MKNKRLVIGIIVVFALALVFNGCTATITGEAKGGVKPQCSDKIDNDKDGYCDFLTSRTRCTDGSKHGDPDCSSTEDNKEAADCIPSAEICDNKDNDCDGSIDEALTQQCGVTDIGACQYGTQTCSAGVWSDCVGNINPTPEVCEGNIDEDCDGRIDNGCNCTNGQTKQCGVTNIGACEYGTSTCVDGSWGECIGNIDPTQEICDGADNNCNGVTDENLVQQCGVTDIGECQYGTSTCLNGSWGSCQGNIDPITEICDGKDNDCDGVTDDSCECINGQTRSCGSNTGECVSGTQTCSGGVWGACVGEVGPSTEICDTLDNDCDSYIDEGLSIQCNYGSDCGTAGWVGSPYCKGGHVYKQWVTYQCMNAGTCSSNCSSQTTEYLYIWCPAGCMNGQCLPSGNETNST